MIEKYVDEAELKRLLSSLAVVLVALMGVGLFYSIIVPGLRNANKPAAPTPVLPVVGEPGWLDPTEFPAERGKVIPPVDPKILMAPSRELIEEGKTDFAKNCTPCHGETGQGDGPAAATMNPRPRNFTKADGWVNGADLPAVYKTLTNGIAGSSMASFDYLSRRERMALAHYVLSLGPLPPKPGSPEAMDALSKALASAGGKTPNRIPVSAAMRKLVDEFKAPAPISVAPEDQDTGAAVFRRVIADPDKAAQTLAGSPSWRKGVKEFAADILPDVPQNGFSVSLATLNAADWQALHEKLLKLIPAPDEAVRK